MWTRQDCAKVLLAAVVFLMLFPAASRPATSGDATLAAWYLKGEADAVFGARGWTVALLTCKPASTVYVACRMRLDSRATVSLCSHGRFRLDHFKVAGLMSAPKRCHGSPPA